MKDQNDCDQGHLELLRWAIEEGERNPPHALAALRVFEAAERLRLTNKKQPKSKWRRHLLLTLIHVVFAVCLQ